MIDMRDLTPVGEFGSRERCEACASYGAKILELGACHMTSLGVQRGLHQPTRAADESGVASVGILLHDKMACRGRGHSRRMSDNPGFHVSICWAFVCKQSKTLYGAAGQKQRGIDEIELKRQMSEYLGFEPDLGGVSEAVWPTPIVSALTVGVEEGAGLHNIAATLQKPSPEFADLPATELGVPDFSRMTLAQKDAFIDLCSIEREPQ